MARLIKGQIYEIITATGDVRFVECDTVQDFLDYADSIKEEGVDIKHTVVLNGDTPSIIAPIKYKKAKKHMEVLLKMADKIGYF